MGAAILDRKSWGPPSWIGSDVKNAKVTPILLRERERKREREGDSDIRIPLIIMVAHA